MKTVTLCGSMRFFRQMQEIAWMLETRHRWNVLQCVDTPQGTQASQEDLQALAQAHYQKIDLSDGIYVVDIGGYIGESVRQEIAYARESGKEVIFHSQYT